MNDERKEKIIATLKENDSKEIPFFKTKKILLEQGYSETEITHAIYESPYDGKKNLAKSEDPVTKAFRTNPKLTEEIGSQILEDASKHEKTKVVASGVASKFAPGWHAQSRYEFEFFERLGLPYFRIFLGMILLSIVVEIFNLPRWIIAIATALIGLWTAQAFYSRFIKK